MANGQLPNWFDRWLQRFIPTPQQMVEAELKDAQLHVLAAQTQAEYAALCVDQHKLTIAYHQQRIERLHTWMEEQGPPMKASGHAINRGINGYIDDIIEFKTGMRVATPG